MLVLGYIGDVEAVIRSATQLARGGRWSDALDLLLAFPDDSSLNLTGAEVAVDCDFWTGGTSAPEWLAKLDAETSWPVRMVRARAAYNMALRELLAGKVPTRQGLAEQFELLLRDAPDAHSEAWARFYLGLTLDVLGGQVEHARGHYEAALAASSDDYLAGYVLRHLGGLADDAGDHGRAIEYWRASLARRQSCGHLTGALAQLILLRDDMTASDVVRSWAKQLDISFLVAQVAGLEG